MVSARRWVQGGPEGEWSKIPRRKVGALGVGILIWDLNVGVLASAYAQATKTVCNRAFETFMVTVVV
jgi:hypothetical protein